MTKIMVTKRGGYLVPSGRFSEEAFDALPGGVPLVGDIEDAKADVRTEEQNNLFWEVMQDLSDQYLHDGERLDRYEWRDLIIASWRKQKMVRGLNGGWVFLGQRSSKLKVKEMCEVMDVAFAFGAENGVVFTIDMRKAKDLFRREFRKEPA